MVDQSAVEQLQIFYELAMSIGGSIHLDVMLRSTLDTFLRKLNCSSGSVYLWRTRYMRLEPAYAIPRNLERNQSCQIVRRAMGDAYSRQIWNDFCDRLPIIGANEDGGHFYILPLPEAGFMTLVKHGSDLPLEVLKSFGPLLRKMGESCRACLQNEELTATHRQTLIERNMLRALIEGTPTIVFALDKEGRFLVSEGRGLKGIGLRPGDLVGRTVWDVYADNLLMLDHLRLALQGEVREFTVELTGRVFDARFEPVIDDEGAVSGVAGVAYDITERKRALDTLSTVLNTVGEGILTINENSDIVMVNREVETIFGYRMDELLRRPLSVLMPDRYRTSHERGMARFAETGEARVLDQRIELEGLHKDGHVFPLELRISEASLGQRRFFTASVRDITQRKEYDRMRDDFVSTVSHELRTPLASIMGWTETLLTERPGPLTAHQRRFLNIIAQSSDRLNRLIEEILTVSRIQRGTLQLNKELFSPGQSLQNIRDMMEPVGKSRNVALVLDDQWPAARLLNGDQQRMDQVLTNVISNAVKFSNNDTTVTIRSTFEHDEWCVVVSDQGIGIPEADLPRLFQRFFRAQTAKEAQIQGTGLGLYVCKAIVEGHGGEIAITSQVGVGTTVTFHVPLDGERKTLLP